MCDGQVLGKYRIVKESERDKLRKTIELEKKKKAKMTVKFISHVRLETRAFSMPLRPPLATSVHVCCVQSQQLHKCKTHSLRVENF